VPSVHNITLEHMEEAFNRLRQNYTYEYILLRARNSYFRHIRRLYFKHFVICIFSSLRELHVSREIRWVLQYTYQSKPFNNHYNILIWLREHFANNKRSSIWMAQQLQIVLMIIDAEVFLCPHNSRFCQNICGLKHKGFHHFPNFFRAIPIIKLQV